MLSVEFLDSYAGLSLGFVLWCLSVLLSSGSVVLGVARVACLSVLGKSLVDIVFEAEVLLINHVYSDW